MFGIPFGGAEPIASVVPSKSTRAPAAVIYVAEPGVPDAQLAAAKVTREQYEDWRKAKNQALRGFLSGNQQDSFLVTISTAGFVHATFMDMRRLAATANVTDIRNHEAGLAMTRAFFDRYLNWGDRKAWTKLLAAPGDGVVADKLDRRR